MLRKLALAVLACVAVAGCAVDRKAPYEEIAAHSYVHDGPPSLTLFTVKRTKDGSGAHSALLINATQRVLFDPAGSFEFPTVPERGDLLYGITPRVLDVYIDFHARESFDVLEQRLEVSPEVAALALRLAQEKGAVPPARCALSIAEILRKLPGFEGVRAGWYPNQLAKQFGAVPGVVETIHTDTDSDNNHGVLIRASEELREEGML